MRKIILVIICLITFNNTMVFSMEKCDLCRKTINSKFRKELISIVLKKLNIDTAMKDVFSIFYVFYNKQMEIIKNSAKDTAPCMQMKINNYMRLNNKYPLNGTRTLNRNIF